MSTKSVFIATPMYGGMCTGKYSESLINTVLTLMSNDYEVQYGTLYNESLITKARNTLTAKFLESNCEYLLFLDADQSFQGEDILKMLEQKKDVLGGIIPLKELNWENVKEAAVKGISNIELLSGSFNVAHIKDSKPNESYAFEVEFIGTGMLLIHRSVFEKLKDKVETYTFKDEEYLNYWSTAIHPEYGLLGEDYHFCELCKQVGIKVYATNEPTVSHIGNYEFKGKYVRL
jgi:hypothetical protein